MENLINEIYRNNLLTFQFSDGSKTFHSFTPESNKSVFASDLKAIFQLRMDMRKFSSRKASALPLNKKVTCSVHFEGADMSHAITGMSLNSTKIVENIEGFVNLVFRAAETHSISIGKHEFNQFQRVIS